MQARTVYITRMDLERLNRLLDSARHLLRDRQHVESLQEHLDRAEIIVSEAPPPDVVALYSEVGIKDLNTGEESAYTLVFPREGDISRNRISVLAPLGMALLGQRVGHDIEIQAPARRRRFKIMAVRYPSSPKTEAA